MISLQEQKRNAKEFVKEWSGIKSKNADEDKYRQTFWNSFCQLIGGVSVDQLKTFIEFEKGVRVKNPKNGEITTKKIDCYIPSTKVLIEQKQSNVSLDETSLRGGEEITPYHQAQIYNNNLPNSERANYIITSNFKEIRIYDLEHPNDDPVCIKIEELVDNVSLFDFMFDIHKRNLKKEQEISIKAGDLVGKIYAELRKKYKDPDTEKAQQSINQLCVRIVFCLYAEDAGIFGKKNLFHDYLSEIKTSDWRRALIDLFKVLDTQEKDRDPYLEEDNPTLASFPYVNGGMFSDENIEIPSFNEKLRELILREASDDFDWSQISPTIFGAVFESTLNPETRRKGGMHYTSIENIHKVIDPLFLDDLKEEFNKIKSIKQVNKRAEKAKAFQDKLGSLKFLDPACGSGNFLTESYLSLRRLENETIKLYLDESVGMLATGQEKDLIKVSIQQFYGIEINDFAVSVAKTALWIAESQMFEETNDIVYIGTDFLPLKTYSNIYEGNALRMDWNDVVPNYELNYIMGNPPFVGARMKNDAQKEDLMSILGKKRGIGDLDYVCGWYMKAVKYMKETTVSTAFVSTNSISQGMQTSILWNCIYSVCPEIIINFAYRSFIWNSEVSSKNMAHVHVVIIGFSRNSEDKKILFNENGRKNYVKNINPYLFDGPNILISSRNKNISSVKDMCFGNMPNDNGYLSNYSEEEYKEIVSKYPRTKKFFKPILGSKEFLNSEKRYCIWLKDVSPSIWKNIKPIYEAVKNVKSYREKSPRKNTRKLADVPYLFGEIRQSGGDYLLVPSTSSEKRSYIPMGFFDENTISTNANLIIPDADLYYFGILESSVHMAWMRVVAGRLEMRYRYSAKVVYNNFPWPNSSKEQKEKIKQTAQAILDARNMYPESSLADLYDDLTMPIELRKAHKENDKAVMDAYGMSAKASESKIISKLFELYTSLIDK